jgi:ABC-type uncharacterized transport system auxiliary subunit
MKSRILGTVVIAGALLPGCLTPGTIEPTRYYTLSPTTVPGDETGVDQTLGIRPLIGAKPYKLEMAYRAEKNRLAYFVDAEWAELPATLVSRALSDSIIESRLFSDAGDAADMARPDFVLSGELRRFEADYTGEAPLFIATIAVSVRETGTGERRWHDLIEARVPLKAGRLNDAGETDYSDIARGASLAVSQLSAAVCEALR